MVPLNWVIRKRHNSLSKSISRLLEAISNWDLITIYMKIGRV
jgi:hypothetical protein